MDEIEHMADFKRRVTIMCSRLKRKLDKDSFAVGMQSIEVLLITHLIRDGHDKEEYMQYFSRSWDEYERISYEMDIQDMLSNIREIEKRLGLNNGH